MTKLKQAFNGITNIECKQHYVWLTFKTQQQRDRTMGRVNNCHDKVQFI